LRRTAFIPVFRSSTLIHNQAPSSVMPRHTQAGNSSQFGFVSQIRRRRSSAARFRYDLGSFRKNHSGPLTAGCVSKFIGTRVTIRFLRIVTPSPIRNKTRNLRLTQEWLADRHTAPLYATPGLARIYCA
jgi:hypothetical protein